MASIAYTFLCKHQSIKRIEVGKVVWRIKVWKPHLLAITCWHGIFLAHYKLCKHTFWFATQQLRQLLWITIQRALSNLGLVQKMKGQPCASWVLPIWFAGVSAILPKASNFTFTHVSPAKKTRIPWDFLLEDCSSCKDIFTSQKNVFGTSPQILVLTGWTKIWTPQP